MKHLLFTLLLVFGSQQLFAQNMCSNVILNKTGALNSNEKSMSKFDLAQVTLKNYLDKTQLHFLKFTELEGDFSSFKGVTDPKFVQVLEMYLNTMYTAASQKESFEKGELRLAHRLPEINSTIEYVYKGDKRFQETRFILSDIVLFKANGTEIKITKAALTDDAARLAIDQVVLAEKKSKSSSKTTVVDAESAKKLFATESGTSELDKAAQSGFDNVETYFNRISQELGAEDAARLSQARDQQRIFSVPTILNGKFAQNLIKTIEIYENLDREEVRIKLKNNKMFSLRVKSKLADIKNEVIGMGQKQLLKNIFYGSIPTAIMMYILNMKSDDIEKKIENTADAKGMDQMKNPITLNHLNKLADIFIDSNELDKVVENQSLTNLDKKTKKMMIKKHKKTIEQLIEKETQLGGSIEFTLYDVAQKKSTRLSQAEALENSYSSKSNVVVITQFQKQNKLVLSVVEFDKDQSNNVDYISYTTLSADKHPASFARVQMLKQIQDQKTAVTDVKGAVQNKSAPKVIVVDDEN